MFDSLLYLETK